MKNFYLQTWFTLSLLTLTLNAQNALDSVKIENLNDVTPIKYTAKTVERIEPKILLREFKEVNQYDSLLTSRITESSAVLDSIEPTTKQLATDFPTDTLKARLAYLNSKTPIKISYHDDLEKVIRSYLKHRRPSMKKILARSKRYFTMFEKELDEHNIPLELKYLTIVESSLNPRAKSPVGATGLWQFMYPTGKMYGLDVNSYVDERSDPIRSTKAACKYLSHLHSIYKDWNLAMAAYNSGPGNVNKAIRRSGGHKNYWNIRSWLPKETAGYVPAFLATLYILEFAEEHGIYAGQNVESYAQTDTVWIKSTITFDQVSEITNIPKEELIVLNPAYKLNVIPKVKGKNYALRLPMRHMAKFVDNERAIYAYINGDWASYEESVRMQTEKAKKIIYKVKSGDYLGKIAKQYGVAVSQIQRWNGMKDTRLLIGQQLTIYARRSVSIVMCTKNMKCTSDDTKMDSLTHWAAMMHNNLWLEYSSTAMAGLYLGLTVERNNIRNHLSNDQKKYNQGQNQERYLQDCT